MQDHPNAAVVRCGYEALARHDAAGLAAVFPEACAAAVGALLDCGEFDGALTPLAMAASNDLVVVIDRLCGRGGRPLDVERVSVFRLVAGRIVEIRRL